METLGINGGVVPVGEAEWDDFAPLTYPAYRRLDPAADLAALGTISPDGQPTGLLLARAAADATLQVLSLYVVPAWRRRGLATRLLAAGELIARLRGARRLALTFTRPHPGAEALEALLCRAGWSAPGLRSYLAESSLAAVALAPWMKGTELPAGFALVPWIEFTSEERGRVRALTGQAGWHGPELAPEAAGACLENVSLALRQRGEIVGWMTVHPSAPGYLRYSTLFIREAHRCRALALQLLAAVIRRHAASDLAAAAPGCLFNLAADNAPMLRLARRRLFPYLVSLKQTCGTEKLL